MKSFNTPEFLSEEREFEVQDQKFTWQDVRPEVLSSFEIKTNGKNPNEVWDIMDRQILLFLLPDEQKRWKELRARTDKPVNIAQINGVLTWLMEAQSGRPIEPPSPSDSGPGNTEASSTGA